ncbi:hypothetical protein MNBD_PLANCTO02-2319 [hydrothermal vent metagenome]|uniref:VWFA domain-containing protein n=1 Tax=hydrothermal vent metagenome TaxID=652676 RepID=A0A3B1DVN1_9ZZZZ
MWTFYHLAVNVKSLLCLICNQQYLFESFSFERKKMGAFRYPDIYFQYPELLLLAIPLLFAFWQWGWVKGATGWLRASTLLLLLFALTGPELNWYGKGIDIVVVVDRSRSMPAKSFNNLRELIENLDNNRNEGDRIALVTFGSDAHVERTLSTSNKKGAQFVREVLPDGSNLNDAIATALNLTSKNRPARILVFSDGESNGASPLLAARRAREEGIPIDYRLFERLRGGDVAIESVLLPKTVSPREPFQYSVWVYSDREISGEIQVLREGEKIAKKNVDLSIGMNRIPFRDLLERGGFYNYSVIINVQGDPLKENNVGAGIVRVEAGPKVLVLNNDGQDGNMVRALRSANIPVDVFNATDHSVTQDSLDPYRAVIIENVPAANLGRLKMERLTQFVEDLGGGLMLTGGERSYGTGGYFKSPLDDILPVSMELREDHRKNRVAIAIALDRSGSMTATVSGGKTKMDLANLGTAECVKLLSPQDMVSVIAVDSSPHIIQPMTTVDNPEGIASKVLRIQSTGGGIYVYEALVAAGKELMKATNFQTRHIILFSDAMDSEEPGDYKKLLKKFEGAGITVSVIGLGKKTDVDAKLLEDIAKRGKGNIMFTSDAKELPRLFTQDTMSIARNTFITKDDENPDGFSGKLLPDARLLGDFGNESFPKTDGYNLCYLKKNATLGVVSTDEYQSPWSSFWYRGLGRVASLTIEVDGKYSGQFGRWDNYDDFLITQTRWLMGSNNPNDLFVEVVRDGQDALVTVELDPERSKTEQTTVPQLIVVPPGAERMKTFQPKFIWTGPDTMQARFRLDRTGTFRTLIHSKKNNKQQDSKIQRGPAITLPYSPEYAPRLAMLSGKETLAELADLTNGKQRADILEILADPPRSTRMISILPWLIVAGILLMLVEIAGRRLSLWERVAIFQKLKEKKNASSPKKKRTLSASRWGLFRSRKKKTETVKPISVITEKTTIQQESQPKSKPEKVRSMDDLIAQAKQRAKRRTD